MIVCNENWVKYKPYGTEYMYEIMHKLHATVEHEGIELCHSMTFVRY